MEGYSMIKQMYTVRIIDHSHEYAGTSGVAAEYYGIDEAMARRLRDRHDKRGQTVVIVPPLEGE